MPHDHEETREISVFRPNRPGIKKMLGDLEADIMEAVWALGPDANVTVKDVHGTLLASRGAAYTTIMTVMGILAKKGLLDVRKDAFAHQYQARQTKAEFTNAAVGAILDQLLGDFAEPTWAHFAKTLDSKEPETIVRLRALIEHRRKQSEV
jgi:predicted transcriptional regulator